jgi:hypothetical protein
MKIVFQNPQLTSDTMRSSSQFPGMHDYAVEFLRKFRPAVRIWPLKRFVRWYQFLRRKRLPLTGWTYVFSEREVQNYDVWLSLTGNSTLPVSRPPTKFSGLKVHHVMDYSHRSRDARELLDSCKVDFLLGYSSHDRWCEFFRHAFPRFAGRVLPVPFGYSNRFEYLVPFPERIHKCAVMGVVNPVRDPKSDAQEIAAYTDFFHDVEWAHSVRAAAREGFRADPDRWEKLGSNFMAGSSSTRNVSYDSVAE